MAVAASMNTLREDITDWLESLLATGVGTMAFGGGGVDEDGTVVSVDTTQLTLTDPQGEFPLHDYYRKNDTTLVVTGRLPPGGILDVPISQAGFKVNERLYAVRNFLPKFFEADEHFDINIEVEF